MAGERDYYEVLEVDRGASAEAIRKAYRRLARQYHPDVNKSADAATRFAEVQEAYDVLSDAEKRKAYDRFGHAGVGVGQGPGGFGAGWSGDVSGVPFDASGFSGVFEEIFGRRAADPFGSASPGTTVPRSGTDVHHTLSVSFMTAALGGSETVRLSVGPESPQTISVKIPPGIDSGAQLRVKGKGSLGSGGGPDGDLMLTIAVGQHPWFRREGLDVYINVPVTIAEATFGTTVTLPLLAGTVELKIPPGASSGQKLRVKAKGLSDSRGSNGDFYAVVQIVAPKDLSERARQLVSDLEPELKNPRDSGPWAGDDQP